jgi:3-oxoacyl-[acyl-carrier-protein] synthase-3
VIKIDGVKISGISACVPKSVVSNEDLTENQKLINSIGVKQRHIASENQHTMDLCVFAAENLIKEMDIEKNSIDAIIFVSQTPEYQLPATACIIQNILELKNNIVAYDVNLGCSGYTHGLLLASSLVQSGFNNVLLLVGDTVSKIVEENDSSSNLLFGDAGSATIITQQVDSDISFVLGSDGSGFESIIVDNSHNKKTNNKNDFLTMNGAEVFTFTLKRIPQLIKDTLAYSKLNKDDINHCIFHQANLFMLKTLARSIDINFDKFLISIDKYGNTSSASIPITICHNREKIVKNPEKVLMAGFGVGLSWSTAMSDLKDTVILPILEV